MCSMTAAQLGFGSLLRLVNLRNQIRAVRCLRAALIVFGPKLRQMCLHSVPIIRPVEILYVQDKPDLETRVGAANSYAGLLAQRHRFVKARVFVAVEYGPDLVAFLEIIQRLAAAAAQTEKPRPRYRRLGQSVRDPCRGIGLDLDQGAGTRALNCNEIGRLCLLAFTEKDKAPLRLTSRSPALEVRRPTTGHRSVGCDKVGDRTREWDCAVAALQIALLDIIPLTGSDIGQRVKMRCTLAILFGEPNLIAPQQGRA